MEKKPEKKKSVDWEQVEKDYRTGLLTDRALGEKHGVSHTAIQKRAKREEWVKDLTARIRQKAEEKVAKIEVAKEVAKEDLATERQLVNANADVVANIMIGHRSDSARLRSVVTALLSKVETIINETELFEQIGVLCCNPDEKGIDKINELYHKVISLPSQTDTTKKLAETMKILIELERKIFKIESGDDPVEAAARGAAQGAAQGVSEGSKSILAGLIAELNDAETSA